MKLLINAIPTKPGGGLTVLVGLLKGWRLLGCDMDIAVVAGDPETYELIKSSGTADQVEAVSAGEGAWANFVWQNNHFRRFVRRFDADVVVTNNHYLFGLPRPQVVHHHNLWRFITDDLEVDRSKGVTNRVRDWSSRKALRSAAANVFVSDFLRLQAERFVPASAPRNYVVRNGLDDSIIDEAKRMATDYDGRPELMAIQSANPHKDNTTMIKTLAELVRRAPDVAWHLNVAGSAGRTGWDDVQQLAARLNVADHITWCGFCGREQLDAMLRKSLCLLCSSVLEAGPLPVIEAIAQHSVPVASRIAANEEFVGDGGVLVPPRSADDFASAIIRIYQQPAYREELVQKGLARIDMFRWSRCAEIFYELLKSAAGT
jgi:glycosyltransferase involved in cell wall biosynthesis